MVGDVIWAPFPFTDLSQTKMRPVLVLADVGMRDWIVCEITSSRGAYAGEITIAPTDMQVGRLQPNSRVRPDRIATLNENIFQGTIGRLTAAKQAEIAAAVRSLF